MKAVQNAKYSKFSKQSERKTGQHGRRLLSILLCLCMVVSMLCNFGGTALSSAVAEETRSALNRIADNDTTDSYIGKLLSSEWGSRYAGRIWTDKSVFAYDDKINLNTDTDGYDGIVGFNSDFGTVFSALASSQVINEVPPQPLDVMFVLDVSGSMGKNGNTLVDKDNFTDSAISKTVDAVNNAIDLLLDKNPNSRFGIVIYGSTAAVLVPLAHYTSGNLTAGFKGVYGSNQGLHFSIAATVKPKDGDEIKYYADNAGQTSNQAHNKEGKGNRTYEGTGGNTTGSVNTPDNPIHVGHITNPQAGLAAAMNQFIEDNTELTWNTVIEGEEYIRLPALIHLTDGQASDLSWIQPEADTTSVNAWKKAVSNWNNVNWKYDLAYNSPLNTRDPSSADYYNPSQLTGFGDAAPVIFQTLMTAAYYKSAVEAYYNSTGVGDKDGKPVTLSCYSIYASDEKNYESLDDNQIKATIDAILGPSEHFKDATASTLADSGTLTKTNTVEEYIDTAYELYKKWMNEGATVAQFTQNTTSNNGANNSVPSNDITIELNATKEQLTDDSGQYSDTPWGKKISVSDIEKNINYVPEGNFSKTGFDDLDDLFQQIVTLLLGQAFIPVSGNNDAGVADSITYKDPLGEYMELKHGTITVEDGSVTGPDKEAYDLAVLLYGEMHGMVRAGVYDFQWNDEYMSTHSVGTHGEEPFPMGWYKGDATNAYQPETYSKDESGTWPEKDPETGKVYETAEDAWTDGWVMRFDFQTLLDFVPIANAPEDGLPKNLDESIKHTVYTCYRFADSQADRNMLRRNPIFGPVPSSLQDKWQAYYEEHHSYPVGMREYSDFTGVYRLSDIRVWTEHTGDFIDATGSITPEDQGGYDDLLYVNIPVSATPTQLAEITIGVNGPISYKDNLEDKTQSTPFRVFYGVGLTEDLIIRDSDGNQTGIDVAKISGEYISTHSDSDTGNIFFLSNWYSNTVYRGYVESEYGYSTRGDAGISFSPDVKNRYYLFQKALPLISHAYRVTNEAGDITPVDNVDNTPWGENGSGNNKTTWENGESASSWSGGEFIGTYTDEEAFKKALLNNVETNPDDGVRYITDEKGYSYPLPDDITHAIITYTKDQLSNVDSNEDGTYKEGSNAFSSDDYFFLCIEYYMPIPDTLGKNIDGEDVPGTQAVCKVYRMIARKGSAFGSGLQSANINNGDMLCWYDINGNCTIEIEYNSRTDTGDNTRGRPTLEKLTYDEDRLRDYLRDDCGLDAEENIEVKDSSGNVRYTSYLELDVEYWLNLRKDAHMADLIEQIKKAANRQEKFDELFDWSVSAHTNGIRVGDMYNNIQPKGGGGDLTDGYYDGNKTKTANNYYVPTLSETSTAGGGLVINNFLGNNGRLEIANVNLMVTKTLVAPDGFKLTEVQQNVEFAYQVFEAEMVGERLAQRLKWNPFSQSWQKRIESLDILTDNSSLLIDTNGKRALFCYKGDQPRQVAEVVGDDGVTKYFYADESGTATTTECTEGLENLYYMYLPSNDSGDSSLTYHLFGSRYEGGDGYDGSTEKIDGAGTTAYYPEGADTTDMADNEMQHFAEATEDRAPGSREYWTTKAELIPYEQVYNAENGVDTVTRWDHDTSHADEKMQHRQLKQFTLVTVIPDPNGVESKVYSPFNSRTRYMTVPLYFGYTAAFAKHLEEAKETFATCTHTDDYKLKQADLFDPNLGSLPPSASGSENYVTQHTANFTLKSGEGLLLTGLGHEAHYRFTEKLTDAQLSRAYVLKHAEQVTKEDKTYTTPPTPDIGVYSVSGTTDYFTEQANYTNTVDPELFVLTKALVDVGGNEIPTSSDVEFTFHVTFSPGGDEAMTDRDTTLHVWHGKKDMTGGKTWKDTDGVEHQMPATAPTLENYQEYLDTTKEPLLETITPETDTETYPENTYTVTVKPGEAVVFYGLIAGTNFSVKEDADPDYPAYEGKETITGTIVRASEDPKAIDPAETTNRADFKNEMRTGAITVEKAIHDDDKWEVDKTFTFTVTLTAADGKSLDWKRLDVTKIKKAKDGSASSEEITESVVWTEKTETDGRVTELTAEIPLKHGERFVIGGIPMDTKYTLKETGRDGYNLEYVVDRINDDPTNPNDFIHPEDFGTNGEITEVQPQANWLFVNAKPPILPFSGSGGVGLFYLFGGALIISGIVFMRFCKKRRIRVK